LTNNYLAVNPNDDSLGLSAFRITGAVAANPPSSRSLGLVLPVIYKAIAAPKK
jgi:hypothetical protein